METKCKRFTETIRFNVTSGGFKIQALTETNGNEMETITETKWKRFCI